MVKGKNLTDEKLREYLISLDQQIITSIKEDETFQFSDTFEHKMKKIIKEEGKIIPLVKYEKYLKIAAAILILTTTITVVQSPPAQAFIERTVKEIIEAFPDRTQIILSAVGEAEPFRLIDPSYIPEGYELEERQYSLEDIKYNDICYKNVGGEEIRYAQSYLQGLGMVLDTENLEEDKIIEYRGQQYRLMLKNGNYRVHWYDLNCRYRLDGDVSRADIVKMVESIIDNVNKE